MAELGLDIIAVDGRKVWPLFAPHHYLTERFTGHRAWMATMSDGTPVAFTSIISAPSGFFYNGWREHRTVVLPDFQGLGIGARLGDWVGEYVVTYLTDGRGRYYSRTMHPRLGAYRDASPLWEASTHNKMANYGVSTRDRAAERGAIAIGVAGRVAFSHRYVGDGSTLAAADDNIPPKWRAKRDARRNAG